MGNRTFSEASQALEEIFLEYPDLLVAFIKSNPELQRAVRARGVDLGEYPYSNQHLEQSTFEFTVEDKVRNEALRDPKTSTTKQHVLLLLKSRGQTKIDEAIRLLLFKIHSKAKDKKRVIRQTIMNLIREGIVERDEEDFIWIKGDGVDLDI